MPKLTPEELLRAIASAPTSAEDDEDTNGAPDPFDAAVAEVLAMTPEERRRDLEKAGIDVEAMHAETAALLGRTPAAAPAPGAAAPSAVPFVASAELAQPEGPDNRDEKPRAPLPLPRRRRPPRLLLLAATLAVLAAAAAAYLYYAAPAEGPSPPRPPASAPVRPAPPISSDPALDIATLRKEGMDACRSQRWQDCKDRLDLADRYDPAGSREPTVALARSQAALALRGDEAGAEEGNENAKQPGSLPAPRSSAPR